MVRLIDAATRRICLESYVVRSTGPAERIRAALRAALLRGVRVQILIDAFGSENLPRAFFAELLELGAVLRVFNPSRLLRLSFRNHRKLLVGDERGAIVGGFNIGPEYVGDGINRGWFDLGVLLEGPIAATLASSFDRMFDLAPFTPPALRRFREGEFVHGLDAGPLRLLTSGPGCLRGDLRRSLHRDLRRARHVSVMAAYFLPSRRIRSELARCIRRGGRVELLLSGKSDVALAKRAAEHLYDKLLTQGVCIREYQPQILHAKLIVLDDVVYVGSCNLDQRSLRINYELLLRASSSELAQEARQILCNAITRSTVVTPTQWQHSTGWWQRLRSRLAYWMLARVDPFIASRKLRYFT